jgi:hypothetical protein
MRAIFGGGKEMRALMFGVVFAAALAPAAFAQDAPPPPPPPAAASDAVPPPGSTTTTTTTTSTTTAVIPAGDPMAPLFGNTLIVVDSGGLESHTHFSPDHTFEGVAPAYNYPFKGTWNIDASGNLCRVFDPVPPTVTNPVCGPIAVHAVGDKWDDPKGGTVALVAGIN